MFARRPCWLKRTLLSPFASCRTPEPNVFLTFDDGPHPAHTPAVLERLQCHGVRAAFFLVGDRVAAAPYLPVQITVAGHTLGNHTFSHRRFGHIDISGSHADVQRCQTLIPTARLFRPPFGRLTPGLWFAARRLGLRCMNWSLDSGDWQCRSEADAKACATRVLEAVRPGDIVLFHDDHRWIVPILDIVLPQLAGRTAGRPATL